MKSWILNELDGIIARDPAAGSRFEVALCYPSFHAILFHRLSHWLWQKKLTLLARFFSQIARFLSGIEIHPGAKIGKRLFIDHGIGVVIGETSEIGDDVTLYQGVTLGGVAPSIESSAQKGIKRHPTLCDHVIVGSGAQVLGPITVGKCARVGANAVAVQDVAPGVTVVGIPAKPASRKARSESSEFEPYGTPIDDLPDPVRERLQALAKELGDLRHRLDLLQSQQAESKDYLPSVMSNEADQDPPSVTKCC